MMNTTATMQRPVNKASSLAKCAPAGRRGRRGPTHVVACTPKPVGDEPSGAPPATPAWEQQMRVNRERYGRLQDVTKALFAERVSFAKKVGDVFRDLMKTESQAKTDIKDALLEIAERDIKQLRESSTAVDKNNKKAT